MSKPKLYVDYTGYARPFLDIFDTTENLTLADVVMFTGGADINPEIYGEKRGQYTDPPSARDLRELKVYEQALAKKKPFLGICRGAQLLCALAGGRLAQDITGHGHQGYHDFHYVVTSDNRRLPMNSLHHQMMIPWGIKDHELLAWCEKKLSVHYLDGNNKPIEGIEVEPEVVYFPSNRGLGIQCHPEGGYKQTDPSMLYFKELIRAKLLS